MKPTPKMSCRAIAFVNNHISARLLLALMKNDGVGLSDLCLIQGRQIDAPWMSGAAINIRYPKRAAIGIAGQVRFVSYYRRVARVVHVFLRQQKQLEAYIVNSDNLITSHLLRAAGENPRLRCTVVAEGMMNYQNITMQNRDAWRTVIKPIAASLLGFRWKPPSGHLSGAFEEAVQRVVSFSAPGLKAPPEKVSIFPFTTSETSTLKVRKKAALFVENALWLWMGKEDFRMFANAFAAWVRAQGFDELVVKPHPNYGESAYLRRLLPSYRLMDTKSSVEEIAGSLDFGVIIGTCTTALLTIKLLRPDLRCVDFGSDWYVEKAYFGDTAALNVLSNAGVELVKAADWKDDHLAKGVMA